MNLLKTAFLTASLAAPLLLPAQTPAEDYFVLTPAPGTIESFSNYFSLTAEGGATLSYGSAPQGEITLTCPDMTAIQMQTVSLGKTIRIAFPGSVEIPTAPGDYMLYIPADRFAVDGVGNGEVAYGYTIEDIATPDLPDIPGGIDPMTAIHISPAAGRVTSLSEWLITFDCEWGLANRSAKFRITGPEGVTIPSYGSGSTGTAYSVSLNDGAVLSTPGTYVFTIPEGKFSLGPDSDLKYNPEMSFTYIISDGDHDFPSCTVDPAPGSYRSIDNGYTLTFDSDGVEVADPSRVVLAGPEKDIDITVTAEGSTVTVTPATALTVEGRYQLRFAPGSLRYGQTENGTALSYFYEITSATGEVWSGDYTASPAPGSEVAALKEIDITFIGARKVKVSDQAGPRDFPTLYDSDDAAVTRASAFASGNVLQLSLNTEVTARGSYRLEVPAALILIDGAVPATAISIDYIIPAGTEGIASVMACSPDTAVFTLSGIDTGIKAADISALPAGIYIIAGRKVAITR